MSDSRSRRTVEAGNKSGEPGVVLSLGVVFAGFAMLGGWLMFEGVQAVRAQQRDGFAWIVVGAVVIALGGAVAIAA